MKVLIGLISLLWVISLGASEVLSLEEVWQLYKPHSHEIKASELDEEAASEALARGERHWLPRAYLGTSFMKSDDAGNVLFSKLGQRQVTNSDFSPTKLNAPGMTSFQNSFIGVDLPLYEGGFKKGQVSLLRHMQKAMSLEAAAKKTEEYTVVTNKYGHMMINLQSKEDLQKLHKSLINVLSRYGLNNPSNLLGHSGALGLKSVANRIEGMELELETQYHRDRNWLNNKISLEKNWQPSAVFIPRDFVKKYLTPTGQNAYSLSLLSQTEKANALNSEVDMEMSRYMPRVGLFMQKNFYRGEDDQNESNTAGLYLQWDIFNSDSYGRANESRLKALAMQTKILGAKQNEMSHLRYLEEERLAMERMIELLENSEKNLEEQLGTSLKLFASGMINALQLSDVYNRRVDLFEKRNELYSGYLQVTSGLYQLKNQ